MSGAKFKIGDKVKIKPNSTIAWVGEHEIYIPQYYDEQKVVDVQESAVLNCDLDGKNKVEINFKYLLEKETKWINEYFIL